MDKDLDPDNFEKVAIPSPKVKETGLQRKARKPKYRRTRLSRPKQRGKYKSKFSCASSPNTQQGRHTDATTGNSSTSVESQEVSRKRDLHITSKNPELSRLQEVSVDNDFVEDVFLQNPEIDANADTPIVPDESAAEQSLESSALPKQIVEKEEASAELTDKVSTFLCENLSPRWVPVAEEDGFHLLYLCSNRVKAVQRELHVDYDGNVSVRVHCVELPPNNAVCESFFNQIPLNSDTLQIYSQRLLALVKKMMQFSICTGVDSEDLKDLWTSIPDTYIDLNPYLEESYSSSCRSKQCLRIILIRKSLKRCVECAKLQKTLMKRKGFSTTEDFSTYTPNIYLSTDKAQQKLKQQQEEIRKANKRLSYLQSKISDSLEKDGVCIEEDLNNEFKSILERANLSEFQKVFLEQQFSSSTVKDSRAHRWHPTMIRLAIKLKGLSTVAYEACRDTGAMKLPSPRTLFDYTHCIKAEDGVNKGLLEMVSKQVQKLEHSYQKYHTVICDEMYTSQNLVYSKSDGSLKGYVCLDDVDKEMAEFEKFMKGETDETNTNAPMATKMLAFMVKGITSNVKCVVASFPVKDINKDILYRRAWTVVSHCEGAGIKVLVFVCDGSAVNRAFINMHTPITKLDENVVFDTLNFCAPEEKRPLFFLSDVAHLVKTKRNCLYNSGESDKHTRCLIINGQKVVWKPITRLYLQNKACSLRKSYKLSALNVFPNSFSCMKVKYAAQIFSNTVAQDIEDQHWPDTEELVKILRYGNKFFDCLNGAHTAQAQKSRNQDLAPYTRPDDERFAWLHSYIKYLQDWKRSCESLPGTSPERAKAFLSMQTYDGIVMSVHAFQGAVEYLLKKGAKFIMARAFSQDYIEQFFSQERGRHIGSSTNPNVAQFERGQVSIAIQGQLKTRRRKANVEDEEGPSLVSTEPLPKRPRKSKQQ